MRNLSLLLFAALFCGAGSRLGVGPTVGHYPVARGIVAMGNQFFVKNGGAEDNTLEEPYLHPNLYIGTQISCKWGTVETSQSTYDATCIDTGLANVAAYNATYPAHPMFVKLVIWTGYLAPAWAQALDGGPITLASTQTIGVWWGSNYRAAWKAMLDHLAGIYNGNSLIREVAVTSCAQYSEPFDNPVPTDEGALVGAGYTDALEMACLRGAFNDYASWTKPSLIFPEGPLHMVTGATPVWYSPANVIDVMRETRATFTDSATIGNQAMQSSPDSTFTPWLAYMCTVGGPVEYQIKAAEFTADTQDTAFANGQSYCMTQLEMWNTSGQGSVANVTLPELQTWSAALGGYPG